MIEKIEETIKKFRMLDKGDAVLIGVSGGPDSVCLLDLLNCLKEKWQLQLYIAHLDHKLRAKESDEDLNFVRELARKLNLTIYCEEIDVKEESRKRGLSEEECARDIRYGFFLQTAKRMGAEKIALGHTKDDQVETVLMRFIKGAGLLGLRGIPPKRKINDVLIIRPLIEIWRSQILQYLSDKRLEFRMDSSNLNNAYLRNRIRNQLIPYLEKEFNPNIKEVLANTAENLGMSFEYLNKQGKRRFKSSSHWVNGKIAISIDKFRTFPEAIQKEVIRHTIEELKGDLRRIRYQHWKEIDSLFRKRPTGSIVDLPSDISVEKRKNKLVFYKKI